MMFVLVASLSFLCPWRGPSPSACSPIRQEESNRNRVSSSCGFDRGHVFLISSATRKGEIGWLLCFDAGSKNGWLYRPALKIELLLELHSSVSIKLRSQESPNGSYCSFDGTVTGPKIRGTLVLGGDSSTSDVNSYSVEGYEINPPAKSVAGFPPGRYSNSEYVEESGDAVGAELILFLTESRYVGLIKFNEGYWGEPEFVPLVLLNTRIISPQKLAFELQLREGAVGKYIAILKKNAITLRRIDIPSAPDAEVVRLRRQLHLLP